MVAENWEHVDGHDGSENFELSPRNHNLLMSLLDETQIDDCDDDERLTKVIQSLQAELDFVDHYESWESDNLVDCQSSVDESYGQGCPSMMAPNEVDLHWMDVEILPASPSGEVGNWYVDHHHGQGVSDGDVNDQFGWIKNNFSPIEVDHQDYGSLWHVTNVNFD